MPPTTVPAIGTSSLSRPQIYAGHSDRAAPDEAAVELREQLLHSDTQLVLAFVSDRYDRDLMASTLQCEFPNATTVGCTTAGEIGPRGYGTSGIAGVSFGRNDLVFEVALLENVSKASSRDCEQFAYNLRQKLLERSTCCAPSSCFALLLIDGLSGNEECVARAVHDGLGGIAMVGGSAGDGMQFRHAGVFHDGHYYEDAALLLVAASPFPVTTFKTQHFVSGNKRLVLTGAIPERRLATEINGLPAATEYARAIGVDRSRVDAGVFSAHPLVVKIGGADFVRSVQKVNDDDSLTFFCAIDEGIVFNVSERVDLITNLRELFSSIEQRVGPPQLVIGCDCILRRLEIEQSGIKDDVAAILRRHNVIGFNSYGEQFRGMHINQTFTGVAIGTRQTQEGVLSVSSDGIRT